MTKYLLFGTAFAAQGLYWFLLRKGFRRARRTTYTPSSGGPVSIVVAARNERHNVPRLLTALARQDYASHEVIVVDDGSDDDTAGIAEEWADTNRHIRLVRVTEPVAPRKKNALTKGIDAAAHEVLVFTDADCQPSPGWARSIASHHGDGAGPRLVIGYSPFRRRPGLLNRLARYETFVTGFFTAAAVGLGKPYMAVGRNMSYPKSVFRAIGGFAHSARSLSGDDDLLVQEVVRRNAAEVVHAFDPKSFVPTDAPATWSAWLRQKRRHTSASVYYAADVQAHLTAFHASNALLWTAPLFLGWTGAGLLALKLLYQRRVLKEAAEVLQEQDLVSNQPVLELLYTAYNALIAPLGILRAPRKW